MRRDVGVRLLPQYDLQFTFAMNAQNQRMFCSFFLMISRILQVQLMSQVLTNF